MAPAVPESPVRFIAAGGVKLVATTRVLLVVGFWKDFGLAGHSTSTNPRQIAKQICRDYHIPRGKRVGAVREPPPSIPNVPARALREAPLQQAMSCQPYTTGSRYLL